VEYEYELVRWNDHLFDATLKRSRHHLIGRTKDRREHDWGAEGRVPRVRICRGWFHNPSFVSGQPTPPPPSARIGFDARVSGYEGEGERRDEREGERRETRFRRKHRPDPSFVPH